MTEKNPPEKLDPVVTGETKVKKKNGLQKTVDLIFEPQDEATIKNFIFKDVIAPEIKNLIWSLGTGILNMFLYNNKTPSSKVGAKSSEPMINYRGIYKNNTPAQRPNVSGTDIFTFDRITFSSKHDAYNVLDQMYDILSRYQLVRVSQYLELTGNNTDNYQAAKFGWTNLEGADVVRDFGGDYYIKLPKAYPLD